MKTVSIPADIGHRRFDELPVSRTLLGVLEQLGVHCLADLNRVSLRTFQRASTESPALFYELSRVVRMLREHDYAAQEHWLASEMISIPPAVRGEPLATRPYSSRLARLFRDREFKLVGDLHGRPFRELTAGRVPATAEALRQFVRQVQSSAPPTTEVFVWAQPDVRLQIPAHSENVALGDVPLSVRLAAGLAKLGVLRLGDFKGRSLGEFCGQANFGRRTRAELLDLLRRTQAGEFNPNAPDLASLQPGDIVPVVDRLLSGLPKREQEIFKLRFGWDGGPTATLAKIGARLGLTRERIRQIVERDLEELRKRGGPRLRHLQQRMAVDSERAASPIAPELLEQWQRNNLAPGLFHTFFYLRLLEAISVVLPLRTEGLRPGDTTRLKANRSKRGSGQALRKGT